MSEIPTIDRRVTRTHKLLGAALIDLALEKGYEDVSIQDVTDRADIGYRTFFRHFASKDELLLAVAQSTMDEFEPLVGFPEPAVAFQESVEETADRFRRLFEFVESRERITRVLLLERGSRQFLQPVLDHARQKAHQQFQISAEKLPMPLDMMMNHIATSSLSLIRWWLENDKPYTPQEMGVHMTNIIMLPSRQNMMNMVKKQ